MKPKQLFTLLMALVMMAMCPARMWAQANNVITYTASEMLPVVNLDDEREAGYLFHGLHLNAFDQEMYDHTFENGVGTITFTGDITSIGEYAFNSCDNLTSITLPNSLLSIGEDAFNGNKDLQSINIPSSVISIGERAFNGCYMTTDSLKNSSTLKLTDYGLTIADTEQTDGLMIKGNTAIFCRRWAKKVSIPDGINCIGGSAFENCIKLTSVSIPNSVSNIERRAFNRCEDLTSIIIPSSVNKIHDGALLCEKLIAITFEGTTVPSFILPEGREYGTNEDSEDGREEEGGEDSVFDLFDLNGELKVIYVPAGCVDSYKNNILFQAKGISGLVQPDPRCIITYTSSEKLADIKASDFGNNQSVISHTFDNGTGSITFSSYVTSIGKLAFKDCADLNTITIPRSITSIDQEAFNGCSALTAIYAFATNIQAYKTNCPAYSNLIQTNPQCTITYTAITKLSDHKANIFGSDDYLISHTFENGTGTITFSESVRIIGNYAFDECSNLTSIKLPNSVQSIGDAVFSNCNRLTTVVLPDNLQSIPGWLFSGCSSLTSVNIPSGVESIGESAFENCSSLAHITIPSSVTSIGYCAFSGCKSLASIDIPEGVTEISSCAFNYCYSLSAITFPSSVNTMGENVFEDVIISSDKLTNGNTTFINDVLVSDHGLTIVSQDVDGLIIDGTKLIKCRPNVTTAVIPNTIETIEEKAFWGCFSLSSLTIPSSVTSIIGEAFYTVAITSDKFINNSNFSKEDLYNENFLIIADTEQADGLVIKDNKVVRCRPTATNVVAPETIDEIMDDAFAECYSISSLTLNSCPTYYASQDLGRVTMNLTDRSYVRNSDEYQETIPLTAAPTYSRTMANQWGTIVLPFDAAVNDNYDFYSLTGVDANGNLTLTKAETLPAGTPALIRISEAAKNAETGKYELSLTAANTSISTAINNPAAVDGLTLTGTYTTTDITDEDGYIIANNSFWNIASIKGSNTVQCTPFRAYLAGSISNGANGAKQLTITNDSYANAINSVTTSSPLGELEGALSVYDLNGRPLNNLQQGVNIIKRGGKTYKVIVK